MTCSSAPPLVSLGKTAWTLPPEAEEMRTRIHADVAELAALDKQAQRDKLIETGYVIAALGPSHGGWPQMRWSSW